MSSVPSTPRFSDARVTVRWIVGVVLPIFVLTLVAVLLVPRPEPALGIALFGAALMVAIAALGILWIRLAPVSSN
jgi:hypothetical protein